MPFNWDNIKNIDFNMVSPHWIFDIQKDLDGEKINYNIGYVDDNGILRLNQMSVHQLQTTGLTKLGKQVFIGDVDGDTDICNSQLTVKGTIVAKKIFIDEPSEIAGIHKITGQVLACNTESMDYLATSNDIAGVLEQYKKGWGSIFVENCIGLFSLFEPHPLLIQRELSLNTIEKETQNQDQIHNRIHIKGFRDHKTSINIDTMWKTLPIIRFQEYLYLNDAGKNNMVDDDVEPRLIPLGNNGLRKYPRGGGKPRYDVQWLMGSIDSKFTITVASNYEGDDLFETDLNKNKKALFPENENLVLKQGLEIIPYDDDVVDASTELVFRYRCREIDLNKGNMTFRNKIFGVMPGVDDAAILLDVSGGIVDCKYMETQQAYVSRDLLVGGGVEITNAGLDENGEVNKTTIGGPLRADKYFRLKGDLLLQWDETGGGPIGFKPGLKGTNAGWRYRLSLDGFHMNCLTMQGNDNSLHIENTTTFDKILLSGSDKKVTGAHIKLDNSASVFFMGIEESELNNKKGYVIYGNPVSAGITTAIPSEHKKYKTSSTEIANSRYLFCNETALVVNVEDTTGFAVLVQGNQVIQKYLYSEAGLFVGKTKGIGCPRVKGDGKIFSGDSGTIPNHIIFDSEKHTKMTYETEFLGKEGSWGIMARNPIYVSGSKSRGISRWVGLDYGYSYEVWDDGASASSSTGDRVLGRTDVTDIYGILRKSGGTSVAMSIEATKAIYSHYGVYSSSDKRIKGGIENVPDDWALNVVNNIETKFYLYKNRYNDPDYKTIGFIAQEVREHFPQAVTLRKNYIPVDSVKFLSNMIWNQHKDLWYVKCDELKDISGVKYKLNCFNKKIEFYFDNPNEELIYDEIEVIGNYNNEFVFPKKYVDIFVAGREIDDFHTVAKEKIFTLHHSAIQELSKKNNILEDKVTSLKSELDIMKKKMERLEQLLI